jgi:hypothetical protein
MKRLLYVLGIIAVIAVVILLGYFLRPQDGGEPAGEAPNNNGLTLPPTNSNPPPSLGGLPSTGGSSGSGESGATSKSFGVVAQNPVLDYAITGKNEVLLVEPTGLVVRIRDGKAEVLSSSPFEDVARAGISADGEYVFVEYGEVRPLVALFDVEAREWNALEEDVHGPTWSPSGHRIAFVSRADTTGPSVIATFDAAQGPATARPIVKLHIQDAVLAWPQENALLLQEMSSGQVPGTAVLIDIPTRTASVIAHNQLGLMVNWSPYRNEGLLFRTNENLRGGAMFLYTNNGSVKREFQIVTMPSKCVFSDIEPTSTSSKLASTVICGVPVSSAVIQSRYMPDSYLKNGFFMPDSLYRIDLETGAVDNLLLAAGVIEDYSLDVVSPKVFNDTLFFVNRFDERLYGLALPKPQPPKSTGQ